MKIKCKSSFEKENDVSGKGQNMRKGENNNWWLLTNHPSVNANQSEIVIIGHSRKYTSSKGSNDQTLFRKALTITHMMSLNSNPIH